jgi:predicted enzyme related to lactoylglutathione lyase
MVEIRARDWPALCQFYGSTLGLQTAMRDEAAGFAMFGRAAPYLAVIARDAGAGPSRVVTDFALDDLDGALAELERRGVAVLAPATASPEGYRIAKIADPEGNEIHLFEWTRAGASPV